MEVISKDGTVVVYEKQGNGPAVVLVYGAMCTRSAAPELVSLLAQQFTVVCYDRRGRGESGDVLPYSVAREVEDIDALLSAVGGKAMLYGHSSGAALCLEAAATLGARVSKLVLYDAPYNEEAGAAAGWKGYVADITAFLNAGKKGDAVIRFMKLTGMPPDMAEGMRHSPAWRQLESLGPSLAYDAAVMGDGSIPSKAATINTQTMVMVGGASHPFMQHTAKKLANTLPNAKLKILENQTHNVNPVVLAPVLVEFFR